MVRSTGAVWDDDSEGVVMPDEALSLGEGIHKSHCSSHDGDRPRKWVREKVECGDRVWWVGGWRSVIKWVEGVRSLGKSKLREWLKFGERA